MTVLTQRLPPEALLFVRRTNHAVIEVRLHALRIRGTFRRAMR